MPGGLLVTVPSPLSLTVNTAAPGVTKVALTTVAAVSVTVQPPVPLHAPPHPAKVEPVPGVAVRLTTWPGGKVAGTLDRRRGRN